MVVLIPVVFFIGLFSWGAVESWAEARRKEREAFYKSETLKKVAEAQGPAATAALEYLREQERDAAQRRSEAEREKARRRREGLKLGGLINIGLGIALMVFLRALLHSLPHSEYVYLSGLIPLSIGVALLTYVYFLAPKTGPESQA
jgi:hypothetical protein